MSSLGLQTQTSPAVSVSCYFYVSSRSTTEPAPSDKPPPPNLPPANLPGSTNMSPLAVADVNTRGSSPCLYFSGAAAEMDSLSAPNKKGKHLRGSRVDSIYTRTRTHSPAGRQRKPLTGPWQRPRSGAEPLGTSRDKVYSGWENLAHLPRPSFTS